eukprot:CAMPEP_0198200152 /NCGR_PEP_ID=MMETSP1445-20131203/3212_1 /TAXON_ID=36898 /ORGANISM="Pyramimonas sp., Strain CCMP2087" /LENGTH=43 /DNA_ID= /DNA_START= /DNA_END= /DNA_ORIENTATION=
MTQRSMTQRSMTHRSMTRCSMTRWVLSATRGPIGKMVTWREGP